MEISRWTTRSERPDRRPGDAGLVEAGERQRCLSEVRRAAATRRPGRRCSRPPARASVGEIMNALADVFGRYEPKNA